VVALLGCNALLKNEEGQLLDGSTGKADDSGNDANGGTGGYDGDDATTGAAGQGPSGGSSLGDADIVDAAATGEASESPGDVHPTDGSKSDSGDAGIACSKWQDCGAGRYCHDDGRCRACTDLTTLADFGQLKFASPEPLSTINGNAGIESLRMPRILADGVALLYQRDFFGGQIWLATHPDANAGSPLTGPLDAADLRESGALVLDSPSGQLALRNIVFDRTVAKDSTQRELYGATIDNEGLTKDVVRLPVPFNPVSTTKESNYSLAVSRDRAWWTVNRDSMLDIWFMTAPLATGATAKVVSVNLPSGCAFHELDGAPWVTPDGKVLLVTAYQRNAKCEAPDHRNDLFVVALDAAGQPRGTAFGLPDIDAPESSEFDPSLSPDMCWLYFASDRIDQAHLRLFRARRER
jgi:hypothetical protein